MRRSPPTFDGAVVPGDTAVVPMSRLYFLGIWVHAPPGEPSWFLHEFVDRYESRRVEGHPGGAVQRVEDPDALSDQPLEGLHEIDQTSGELMVTELPRDAFEDVWRACDAVDWVALWAAHDARPVPVSV